MSVNGFRGWTGTTSSRMICSICRQEIDPIKDRYIITTNGVYYHWNCFYYDAKMKV
jgi:hypothetical protein